MKFNVTFTVENAAFRDPETGELVLEEVKRMLKNVIDNLERGRTSGAVIDYNGNNVGNFELK